MVFVPQPGILSLAHVQNTASDTWTIVHNLNKNPVAVDAMVYVDGNLETVIPYSVVCTDANTVVVSWSTPQTGKARIA
jgi:hypothetical protein